MDLEISILSEVTQRKITIIWYCLYVESKKNGTKELIYQKESHRCRKQTYGYWGKEGGSETDWGIKIDIYKLLYTK